jgi:UDP-N-acetyl-D-mannosaminuronic acid transferase (WecB/TagA/CpsF family)
LNTEQILGIAFFNGTAAEAVDRMRTQGGLLVVPAAPALVNVRYDPAYRWALVSADMAIADSGFMVLLWAWIRRRRVTRISGLAYLIKLLDLPELRRSNELLLVVPTGAAGEKALGYLRGRGFELDPADLYIAPQYASDDVTDREIAHLLDERRPKHIIVGLGGGTQEKLGFYLRETLAYRPAIHCIGAALGFLSGDQKRIPAWADRLYLGWLLRLARNPRLYLRRFWAAHELPGLIARYGSELPPLRTRK